MSLEYSTTDIDFNHPRNIWTIIIQLVYTLVAMIPIFYYMKEIVQFEQDAVNVMLLLPIATGIILFILQLLLNEFYWYEERLYKNRDIVIVACKSSSYVLGFFYFFYLFLFGYWFSNSDVYKELFRLNNQVGKAMTETAISIIFILFLVMLRRGIQNQK